MDEDLLGWQGCSSRFPSGFALGKSLGAALPSLGKPRPSLVLYLDYPSLCLCSGCNGNLGVWSKSGLQLWQLYRCLQIHQDPEVLRTGLLPLPARPRDPCKERQGALPTLQQSIPVLLYGRAPQVDQIITC